MTALFTLRKKERLNSLKEIEHLFKEGRSFYIPPLRVLWITCYSSDTNIKILISVPKRKFRRAVDRNRIRRIIREAYRLNKQILRTDLSKCLNIGFIYIGNMQEANYANIGQSMKDSLNRLKNQVVSSSDI